MLYARNNFKILFKFKNISFSLPRLTLLARCCFWFDGTTYKNITWLEITILNDSTGQWIHLTNPIKIERGTSYSFIYKQYVPCVRKTKHFVRLNLIFLSLLKTYLVNLIKDCLFLRGTFPYAISQCGFVFLKTRFG